MRFLGGKARLGGSIEAAILADLGVTRVTTAADLCCGAGNMTHRLADVADHVIAVEAHPGLVALHVALRAGWSPPLAVSEEEYRALRAANDRTNPLTAFAEFGCSFGGKSWGGYAKARGDDYCGQSRRALLRDVRQNVEHLCADALTWSPPADLAVAYCDPPYDGTTRYDAVATVAEGAWWRKMRSLADRGIAAFLSEYADAPPAGVAARLVWSAPTHKTQLTKGTKVERLWRVLPGVHTPPAAAPVPLWPQSVPS
jgi:DNA adenine methylase